MIDVNAETLITFSELARRLPPRRGQRPVHPATIHRWRAKGVRGVRLDAVRVGGSWMSSLEALQRFCDVLTGLDAPERPAAAVAQPAVADDVERDLADRFGL